MAILSVAAVNRYIKALLEQDDTLSGVLVRGEISNFKRHYSGHCYFTLKDSESTLRAVMFRGRAQFLKFEPKDGLKVIAGGQISVFERDGQYQLYVDQLVPEGMGELSLAFAQLKDKLSAEGLFDENRKRPLPLLPQTVGIVTSPTGAAIRDIVTVAKRRYPGVQLILNPVQVQGADAPLQIAAGIKLLNRHGRAEVMIIGRGGGSIEELWAFNDEQVVRAIAESQIPVISAVGHQTDYTLSDFAADRRAATPSQAAEIAVPDVREMARYILTLRTMLEKYTQSIAANRRDRLDRCCSSKIFQQPETLLSEKRQLLDTFMTKMQQSLKELSLIKQHRFTLAAEKLSALSPLAVLGRGYGIVRTLDGKVLRRAADAADGQLLEIVLHEGRLDVEVQRVEEDGDGSQKSRNVKSGGQRCMF